MQKIKNIWKYFIVTLPIWMALIAIYLYFSGYTAIGENSEKTQKFYYSIASALLSGGVFAATLKSAQFLGIFEETLTKIVLLKPEWLRSLSADQLSKLWRDVMVAAVSKGFPGLSDRMSQDVFHNIIPKMGEFYYSNMRREIRLNKYDPSSDILEMSEIYQLDINAHSVETMVPYKFYLSSTSDPKTTEPFKISKLDICNQCHLNSVISGIENDKTHVSYDIELTGKGVYSVVREMTRIVRISRDPTVHMVATRFTDGMLVRVINNVPNIEIEAFGTGVEQSAVTKELTVAPELINTWVIKQLLFPGDGLTLVIKKV